MSHHLDAKALGSLKVLDLCRHSSKGEAKKRWYTLSLQHHPDKAQTDEDKKLATEQQQELNNAWENLAEVLPSARTSELPSPQCCEPKPRAASPSSKPEPRIVDCGKDLFDDHLGTRWGPSGKCWQAKREMPRHDYTSRAFGSRPFPKPRPIPIPKCRLPPDYGPGPAAWGP
jgi:hypothetical protein